ncbi:glycosyltransferase [Inquilinus sp. CAU 1745]|uniref:glycosyltransferase family protein n=1 Tax=Inquilinus sp. CAU 1745 TaxID=3140369 RepID=UPI00325BA8EF
MKVLFHVQHLLGIGHVRRAARIASALSKAGARVTIAQGGFPVPEAGFGDIETIQLPPARASDPGFGSIVGEDGMPIDDGWKARRTAMLLDIHDDLRPDILLLETFPFGRRAFRFELLPLLERARARPGRPLVASSVRDILVAKKDPAKEAEMAEIARRHVDLVLVHGDPAFVPFGASFPFADRIADLIRYTGYVGPDPGPPPPSDEGRDEIIVSVGGGAVGERLLRIALEAARLSTYRWRLLAGPDLPGPVFAALAAAAPPSAIVERARPDFTGLLAHCRASVSQAGYNTVMDILAAGCRSVLVPFAAGGETEQAIRARLLAGAGRAQVLEEATLTPEGLAAAVETTAQMPSPPPAMALNGAEIAAEMLIEAR